MDASLMGVDWMPQRHRDGAEVMWPMLPGPFGKRQLIMADKLGKGPTPQKGLGCPLGSTQLRWFYAD